MRKFPMLLFLLLCLFTISAAQTADEVEVPFKFEKGLMIVDAKIKGDTPVKVVVATGAQYSIIDSTQMEKHKLQAAYAADDVVRGRNDSTYTFVPVSGVSIQGSKSKNLQMRLGSMERVSEAAGTEIFGALGADVFEGQIVQIDFKKSVMKFLSKGPAKDAKDASGKALVVLQMDEKESNPFKKTHVVPNVRGAKINGKEIKLLLDTGRVTTIALSAASAKKLGLTAPEENEQPRAEKVSFEIAGQQIPDLPIAVFPKGTAAERTLGGHEAVVGTVFLKNFVVTLDYKNKTVTMERQ